MSNRRERAWTKFGSVRSCMMHKKYIILLLLRGKWALKATFGNSCLDFLQVRNNSFVLLIIYISEIAPVVLEQFFSQLKVNANAPSGSGGRNRLMTCWLQWAFQKILCFQLLVSFPFFNQVPRPAMISFLNLGFSIPSLLQTPSNTQNFISYFFHHCEARSYCRIEFHPWGNVFQAEWFVV